MAFCRLGALRSCSHLQLSSLSFSALKQNGSNLYVTTQGSHGERKPAHSHLMSMLYLTWSSKGITSTFQIPAQRATFISQPKTLSALILESFQLQNPLSLCSDSSRNIQSYICPSRLKDNADNMVILDNITSITSFYDCPVATIIDRMQVPCKQKSEILEGPGKKVPKMEAKIIMRIRHKKMKKHKLKKLRKRMYFLWSKQKAARKAKKMKIYYKELEEIKEIGDTFSAENFVREQLARAKNGGYGINILDSNVGK